MSGFADAFERLAPDLVVVLGDRFEILAATTTAMMQNIPVVHLHGGETTAGATDESIRHAISKMASLHLVAAEPYRARLVRMGEDPSRIFNFGAPAVEAIKQMKLLPKARIEEFLSFSLDKPTCGCDVSSRPHALSRVLQRKPRRSCQLYPRLPQLRIVMSGVNADAGSAEVANILNAFAQSAKERVKSVPSLGQLALCEPACLCRCNDWEFIERICRGSALGLPVVDIGDRQTGRLAATCIQQVPAEVNAIVRAVETALDPKWRASVANKGNPYDSGAFASRAIDLLKSIKLGPQLLRKTFYDGAAA